MEFKEKLILWLEKAGIRAIKTMAQTFVATIGTSAVLSSVDWKIVISASVLAGILSLATSISGLPELDFEGDVQEYSNSNDDRKGDIE